MIYQKDNRKFLLERHPGNPILTALDWPYTINSVFNPGATLLKNGTTLLLCRVEDRSGISHLCAAYSQNGIDGWQVDSEPTFRADPRHHPEEIWGVEDPRITWMEELDRYAVVYTAYSPSGPAVALALTRDFHVFERLGVIIPPEDKDAALFPKRINGSWVIIHRPTTGTGGNIYTSESPDLIHWGHHRLLLSARRGAWWDASRIGLASPPIQTERGWLMFYHGVKNTAAGCLYRVGLALLDRKEPWRCVKRSDEWIFGPNEIYERIGDVSDVVFPCGSTIGSDGDTIKIYYGGADSCIGLTTGHISELLNWLDRHSSNYEENR